MFQQIPDISRVIANIPAARVLFGEDFTTMTLAAFPTGVFLEFPPVVLAIFAITPNPQVLVGSLQESGPMAV